MNPPVDTSAFQLAGVPDPEEDAQLAELEAEARDYVGTRPWAKPISEMLLAFGVSRILALFLVRFDEPISWEGEEDAELWVIVGDLPPAYFATDDSPNPAEALETYCIFMEDWADRVLNGDDLEGAYPVAADPTEEHARMLKSRLEFIRQSVIPIVDAGRNGASAH
ncbi:hypothetical protein [Phenylobacterium sp.]|uniref:hypothetical protein n=1 Tax=Phenylobacterium sp. TaxID=1871053 RepID=UPI0026302850|nr:hypothetical protein [Phenylobacterium sp.]